MIFVFGGAYQGKLDYALQQFQKTQQDVYRCTRGNIQFNRPVIYGLEEFVLGCVEVGHEATDILIANAENLEDKIIIACDVSCGVVPMDKGQRAFREMMGRTMIYLSKQATEVHRVFCGLGQPIKISDPSPLSSDRKSYIHFIRHGLTEGNVKRWFYGWADIPLLAEGVEALQKLKKSDIYPPLSDADCYTSGLCRTEQTLETIYGPVSHKVVDDLKEINFGEWECKTFEDIKQEKLFDKWVNDKSGNFFYPNGDSINTFYDRVSRGLATLRGCHRIKELSHRHSGQDAISLVVCHGGVIAACMQNLFPNVETATFFDWIPDPGRGYTVFFQDGEPVSYEKI